MKNNKSNLVQAAKNLKELRFRKGISQTELADVLGISTGEVSHWETGRYFVRDKLINSVCEILGCSRGEILGNQELKIDPSSKIKSFRRINIANWMIEKKMSQTKLATLFNPPVSKQFISKVMIGTANFTQDHLKQLAIIFNKSFEDIDAQPKFDSLGNNKIRNNQEYIDLTIEILDEINFENSKYKSRMFPYAYDIVENYMQSKKDNIEEELAFEEKKLEFKKILSKSLK